MGRVWAYAKTGTMYAEFVPLTLFRTGRGKRMFEGEFRKIRVKHIFSVPAGLRPERKQSLAGLSGVATTCILMRAELNRLPRDTSSWHHVVLYPTD